MLNQTDRSRSTEEGPKTGLHRRTFLKSLGGVAAGAAAISTVDRAIAGNGWNYDILKDIPDGRLQEMYTWMLKNRWWEDGIKEAWLAGQDDLYGAYHLSTGQEAIAAGVMGVLNQDDYIVCTHRGHAQLIAKGGDLNLMSAEIFFRETGYNKGYGGSMHITDVSKGILGMNGIVGVSHILAAGAAYGIAVRGTQQVAVAFGGDGSVNNGWFTDAVRNAAHYKLPLITVIEHNGRQSSQPSENANSLRDQSRLAAGYEVKSTIVDGQDVLAVYGAMKAAVDRARSGGGPTIIEAKTYRFYDHNGLAGAKPGVFGAWGLPYRSDRELQAWIANDPIPKFRATLVAIGAMTDEQADQLEASIKDEVAQSIEFARNSPLPSENRGLSNVFAQGEVRASQFA